MTQYTFANKASQQAAPLFWTFVITHTLLWTLATTLSRQHLPIDSLEASLWSSHLLWGYEKNPYVNAWIMAAVEKLFSHADWGIYLSSRLSAVICFWGMWRLGRQFLSPAYTLLGVIALEAIQYFTFGALELNDNVLELAFWSITASYFYTAVKQDSVRDWIIVGIFAGLGMMTKYYTVLLLLSLFFFLLIEPHARNAFKRPGFYIATMLAGLCCLPHVLWLTQNEFITLRYVQHRLAATPTFFDHLLRPLYFFFGQVANFLGAALILLLAFTIKNTKSVEHTLTRFDKSFLLCFGLGPLALSCFYALVAGSNLHTMWGQPLLMCWGLMMVAFLRPTITPLRWYGFQASMFGVLLISCIAYAVSMRYANGKATAHYPGKHIAQEIDALWQKHFPGHPLVYVVGDRWRAGSVSHYSHFHPDVYIEQNPLFAPWVAEADLYDKGAVFFWDPQSLIEQTPSTLLLKFPEIIYTEIRTYRGLYDPNGKAFYVGITLLPPGNFKGNLGGRSS